MSCICATQLLATNLSRKLVSKHCPLINFSLCEALEFIQHKEPMLWPCLGVMSVHSRKDILRGYGLAVLPTSILSLYANIILYKKSDGQHASQSGIPVVVSGL